VDGVVRPGVVAIVPARGGSKSIPRKNIKPLGGVPLIAYSIDAALTAGLVDRVIVSTDDEEIAAVARTLGADVPFLRPATLSGDLTPDLPVFEHALDWLEANEGRVPDVVVQLRPTSPLRPTDCVDAAVALLGDDPAADSVRGVVAAAQNPFKMWSIGGDGALTPLMATSIPEAYNQPRQALPAVYWQTGHVDAIRTSTIRGKRSMTGDRIKALVIDGAYSCDIDTEADWRRVEWVMRHLDRPFVRPAAGAAALPADLRLIVFDFDGVMTDNRVWTAGDGQEWVACDRADGLGIDRLRQLGFDMLVLSTETHPVVAARCRKLGLAFAQAVNDKASHLRDAIAARGIDPAQVAFVGNDVNDLECMRAAGCGVAVADAHPDVLAVADLVLSRRGGDGAVRELCDLVAARHRSHTLLARTTRIPPADFDSIF
jgi:N-acylneuraminate cytidylyltransferase